MAKKRRPEDLSESELRRLMLQKRNDQRKRRLDDFRRTGRLVLLSSNVGQPDLEDLRSSQVQLPPEKSETELRLAGRQRLFDRLLLAVEVIAILGLVYLAFNGANLVRELNDEVAAALELPTLTPTPLITAVVLPSGHTPPTSPGGARPNDAEIPEHLRPLVQSLPSFDLPTPSPEQAVRIQIPAIGVDHPIVQGDGWEQLKKGVGQHLGTANPGQIGNLVLSAHNDIFGEIFRFLDQLSPGDEIVIFTNIRSYTYVISNTQIVEPTFVQVMDPTSYSAVTLISCYPYLIDTERIVIQANLVDG
ncbi:MAG: sortase [Chloroflexi bacterium]|nr:sortase [Chloroflexota bacterium]